MADMHHYTTAISQIISSETEEEIVLRGHRLSDLIQNATFADAVFLMLAGHLPTKGQARTLDALLTACVDHGLTPAAMIGRAYASYGTNAAQAIAGGVLLFGDIAGGAGEPLAALMTNALAPHLETNPDPDDATIDELAKRIVADALQNAGRMPGFGIPAHQTDPRSPALLKVAQESRAAGPYTRLLVAMEREVALAKGRPIPINLDGIVAALVLDFGFPEGSAAGFVMIPRSFSTLAHHLEEKTQHTRWRHVPQEHVTYTGPMPTDRSAQ